MMRILLTGTSGQVGWELRRALQPLGQVIAVERSRMDLTNPDSIRKIVREVAPQLIVNPAAYTAVDKAESEPDLSMAVNGVAPGIMAEEAKRVGAAMVHYSTDYVFDGTNSEPYTEEHSPRPINVYGRTKLAGELAIQAAEVPYLIFRTSWVYGLRGKNFLLTMLRLAKERDELHIVTDQIGAPTWSRTIAEVTALALARCSVADIERFSGVYHLTARGLTSWFGFAQAIIQRFALHSAQSGPKLLGIATANYQQAAKRPANSAMSSKKFAATFDLALPQWDDALALCLDQSHCI
jgi:dTDP-4-dehydrorhamnose reductase